MNSFLRKWLPAESETSSSAQAGSKQAAGRSEHKQEALAEHKREIDRATALLNLMGVRIMKLKRIFPRAGDGVFAVGVWADLDGPEIRAALRTLRMEPMPVRYLEGAGIQARYKLRQVKGEPIPTNVLSEMGAAPGEPWKVRDQMLNEMRWCSQGIPWAEWKAATLNRLFQEQGLTGQPGAAGNDTRPGGGTAGKR